MNTSIIYFLLFIVYLTVPVILFLVINFWVNKFITVKKEQNNYLKEAISILEKIANKQS
jgi:uncharacterized membrane protein YedE/YeeE